MKKVFISCGDYYGGPTPSRVYSTLEAAKAGGTGWVLEMVVDDDNAPIISHDECIEGWVSIDITKRQRG